MNLNPKNMAKTTHEDKLSVGYKRARAAFMRKEKPSEKWRRLNMEANLAFEAWNKAREVADKALDGLEAEYEARKKEHQAIRSFVSNFADEMDYIGLWDEVY